MFFLNYNSVELLLSAVTIGFLESSYTVDESVGTTMVGFGVLSGTLGKQITVDFEFASGTATGTH